MTNGSGKFGRGSGATRAVPLLLAGYRFAEAVPASAPRIVHLAIAFAGRLAADLGADVMRVVPTPDPLPNLQTHPTEVLAADGGVLHRFLNRGKRNCATLAEALPADVVLTANEEAAALDGTSVVHVSAYPPGSEYETQPVSELALLALSGLADLFGEPDQAPVAMGGHQPGVATGYGAFTAAMSLLAGKVLQGRVLRAQVDALSCLAWINWKAGAMSVRSESMTREGARADWPVLPCKDGHVALVIPDRNWPLFRDTVGDPRMLDRRFATMKGRRQHRDEYFAIVEDWLRRHTTAQLRAIFYEKGIPSAPILSLEEQLSDPLHLHQGLFTTIEHGATQISVPQAPCQIRYAEAPRVHGGNEKPRARGVAGLPLAGIRVLDFGIMTAGAGTSALLGDLGAEVLKIESNAYTDPFRAWSGQDDDSPYFKCTNRNKKGISLDAKSAEGHEALRALATDADLVLENFRRGVAGRIGLTLDNLGKVNPRIVLASISGQGADGPGVDHVTYGSTLESLSGLAAATGEPQGPPVVSGRNLNFPDQSVCLYATAAVIATLLHAKRAGVAAHIDISQRDVTLFGIGELVAASGLLRHNAGTWRFGNKTPDQLFQGIYPTRDRRYLTVSVETHSQLAILDRIVGGSVSEESVARWVGARDADTAATMLREAGIAAMKVMNGAEVLQHPVVRRGTSYALSPTGALVKGFPFQLLPQKLTIYADAPAVGEHTADIFAAVGGAA
jgi:crotonobetainyl-CoA:carnitine CoA-transferase CaiB-like acyl-CoA transferase